MHTPIVARVSEQRSSGSVLRTVQFDEQSIFFEVSGDVLPPPMRLHDFAAVALVFLAMRTKRPLKLDGPATEALIRNLEEFQEAWAAWVPETYAPVPILADNVSEPMSVQRRGVFALSLGIDGAFALLRHRQRRAGLRNLQPAVAMLVHGFDIPLSKDSAFDLVRSSATEVARALEVPLSVVRTNWKQVACRDWAMEFGAGLAACLHQFSGLADVAVIGSDEDYAHLEIPWGSNPVTNHLLSGAALTVHTEGGGFTRTQKVAAICEMPELAKKIRVCWEGPITGRNCGRCEKCVRTKLNFMVNGQHPSCFEGPATLNEIQRIRTTNKVQLSYLEEILEAAKRNHITDPWVSMLRAVVLRNRLIIALRPVKDRLCRLFKVLISRLWPSLAASSK